MIRINKGAEPAEWTAKKLTSGFNKYESIAELREALLQEQGYICAYCMRKIPVEVKDRNESETSKIEHIKSRDSYHQLQLNYDNMVICCPGNINGEYHCDKSKGNRAITFSPFEISTQRSISYGTKDGTIKSNLSNINDDINSILCLNNGMLKANRFQELQGTISVLEKRKWKKAQLEIKLKDWSTISDKGMLKPYCGIVIWYLEKKLKQK
jgi:uncharacterized protein (TIGR02646 family)